MDMMKKLPFFLPFGACRGRCVYCDQRSITGQNDAPSPDEVQNILKELKEPHEICFFGGSFCRFGYKTVRSYLDAVRTRAPRGSRIRFSTHPCDFDDPAILPLILEYNIGCIELGIPSLDPEVLSACKRQERADGILENLAALRDACMPIGVQIMIGLPGQTPASSLNDLKLLAEVKGPRGWDIRIYPCLVLQNTELAAMQQAGLYQPLSLPYATEWGGAVLTKALQYGFNPIRIGLQETTSLRAEICAGPYHPAAGELIFSDALTRLLAKNSKTGPWAIPANEISKLTGHADVGLNKLSALTDIDVSACRDLLSLF